MPFAVYPSIVNCACVQMVSAVNQPNRVPDTNVRPIVIVKVIHGVKLVHVEMHAYNPERVALMPNVVSSIDKHNAHVHHPISEIQRSNVCWNRMFVPAIRAVQMLNVVTLAVELMNVFAHPIVLVIHTKDANAVARN